MIWNGPHYSVPCTYKEYSTTPAEADNSLAADIKTLSFPRAPAFILLGNKSPHVQWAASQSISVIALVDMKEPPHTRYIMECNIVALIRANKVVVLYSSEVLRYPGYIFMHLRIINESSYFKMSRNEKKCLFIFVIL